MATRSSEQSPSVGILMSGDGMTLDRVVELAVGAEEAGFDSVWHVEIQREPFVPLAAIAAGTKTIRLGSGVATWTRSPVTAALTAADLDELSHGRFLFGVGTGPPAWNENYHGIAYERPVERLREYVEAIRAAWTAHDGAVASYEGEHFRISGFSRALPQARERIPVFIAAVQRRMLAMAGAVGDGVLLNVFTTPLYLERYALPHLGTGAERAGRPLAELELASAITTAVDADGAQAREWARRHLAFYAVIPYFDIMFGLHGFEREAAAVRDAAARGDTAAMFAAVPDEMVDTFAIAGTPDECRVRLRDFAGLDVAVLFPPSYQLGPDEIEANHLAILEAFNRP